MSKSEKPTWITDETPDNASPLPTVLEPLEPIIRRPGGGHNAHSAEVKLRTILLIAQQGVTAAAKETGIPLKTVKDWAMQAKDEIALIRETEFVEEIDQKIRDILSAIEPNKIESANFRDLLVGLGIALDKRQQLLGPQKKQGQHLHLRAVFKGEGAIEVTTVTNNDERRINDERDDNRSEISFLGTRKARNN